MIGTAATMMEAFAVWLNRSSAVGIPFSAARISGRCGTSKSSPVAVPAVSKTTTPFVSTTTARSMFGGSVSLMIRLSSSGWCRFSRPMYPAIVCASRSVLDSRSVFALRTRVTASGIVSATITAIRT